jgi:hypothetical protein
VGRDRWPRRDKYRDHGHQRPARVHVGYHTQSYGLEVLGS